MGRKPILKEAVKEIKKPIEVTNKDFEAKEKADAARAEVARLDTDKANKDILIKTARELHKHIEEARAELQRTNRETENRYSALKHLEDEIKSQNYIFSRQKEKFDKENAELIKILDKRQIDIDAADAAYKSLLVETAELKKKLQNGLKEIEDERRAHGAELARLQRHVHDVETAASKQNGDMEQRESKIKADVEAFEAEKEALKPELSRISEIKNENLILLQEIEASKSNLEHQKSLIDSYKKKIDADLFREREILANREQAVANEEGKFRKWEQDIKDFDLEVRAREAEAEKSIRRHQLTKIVSESEKS